MPVQMIPRTAPPPPPPAYAAAHSPAYLAPPPAYPPQQQVALPANDWQTRALVTRPMRREITEEPFATRAAINRIALHTKVGPHRGPGSGALLTAHISKMKSQFDRLDRWQDDSDTDRESNDGG